MTLLEIIRLSTEKPAIAFLSDIITLQNKDGSGISKTGRSLTSLSVEKVREYGLADSSKIHLGFFLDHFRLSTNLKVFKSWLKDTIGYHNGDTHLLAMTCAGIRSDKEQSLDKLLNTKVVTDYQNKFELIRAFDDLLFVTSTQKHHPVLLIDWLTFESNGAFRKGIPESFQIEWRKFSDHIEEQLEFQKRQKLLS